MWVAVRELVFFEQCACVRQFLHDPRVRSENRLALQIAGFSREPAFRIHRSHHWQAVAHADFVVFLTMTGSDMNRARALVLGDKFTEDDFDITIDPRMTADHAFQVNPGPGAFGHLIRRRLKP